MSSVMYGRSAFKGVVMRNAPPKRRPGLLCPHVLADIGHGSHVCAFYETKDDLIDLVLPFFAAGQDRNELCVWMMPDSINADEARSRTSGAVADPGIEFRRARDIYLRGRRFAHDSIVSFWDQKMQQAQATNRSGTRASGDAFWLQRNDWNSFLDYETYLNTMIANKPIMLLCTYPASVCKVGDAFDVIRAHQFTIAKRGDEWEVVTAPAVNPDRHAEVMDAAARVSSLTRRERQVLEAIIDGRPNKVIAYDLALDVRTIEAHRARLMRRLGVRTMVEAVRLGTLASLATLTPPSSTR
jgi:DNA-binding CsgD family transcriptional regulator